MEKNVRLKVLVSAYTCSPYRGSEFAVGWGFISALAPYHELWVITEEEKCRKDIEQYLAESPGKLPNVRFYYLRKRRNRKLRKFWPPSYYWYYREWHKQAFILAKELHSQFNFDLVHQLTMVGFREPGYLWRLGIPFVWGPVGGMGFFPWRFLGVVGAYGAFYYLGYNFFNFFQMRYLVRPRAAAQAAGDSGLILATKEHQERAAYYWGISGRQMAEVGLPRAPRSVITERKEGEPLRIIWTGLHIPRKALNLGLLALARLPEGVAWELQILGEGPLTVKWKKMAERLGIGDNCRFLGWMEREKALDIMENGHLLLITSLRDLTSTVTVEALALGLPIVCLDHCGFADVVDEQCGLKVPVTKPSHVVGEIAGALERLAVDEPLRRKLALGALARASEFDWKKKAMVIDRVYRGKLAEG